MEAILIVFVVVLWALGLLLAYQNEKLRKENKSLSKELVTTKLALSRQQLEGCVDAEALKQVLDKIRKKRHVRLYS